MSKPSGKYDRLKSYLRAQSTSRLPMTFSEIEKIVGSRLPRSAKLYRTWWSNDGSHHVQANAWLGAGYRTEQVDMETTRLVFVREIAARGMAEEPKMFDKDDAGAPKQDQHPMIGALKGTFTIEEGYDLTQPAMPEWADLMDEKYGPEKGS
jgi:hypothetical protein